MEKKQGILQIIVLSLHNLSQSIIWLVILVMLNKSRLTDEQQTYTNLREFFPKLIETFQIAQALQALEVFYVMIGWQKANLFSIFFQMLGRLGMAFIFIPLSDKNALGGKYFIFSTLLMFSITESIRYPYYLLKLHKYELSPFGILFGHLRYSVFIITYPIGAFGELMVAWGCLDPIIQSEIKPQTIRQYYLNSGQLDYSEAGSKMYSILMPNDWNFAFDFEYLIYCLPGIYITIWPMLYLHMFKQRKQYFQQFRAVNEKKNK